MSNGVLKRPASFGDLSSALLSSVQGKQKEFPSGNRTPNESAPAGSLELNRAPKAWWLDVASPTWDDLQAIGKLLHIHPLTLEDILQQDPREKMELFSRLGYYFISFRTIQNAAVTQPGDDVYKADDGALREANIYVVVFKEGICTVEHIEKVRNRLQLLQDSFNMSSDWIAHGILDSVVDSFFPFLKEIEQQVLAVEALVFSSNDVSHTSTQATTTNTLLRMARARRLVTSLTRLLATKSEVISQIRKRFLIGGRQTTSPQGNDDLEIAMYMGDVQDHILTLQQSLHHYEHMLSDSHPAYLTQLQTRLAMNKGYTDKAILVLSLISIGIPSLQIPIGLFSQNLKIPKNSVNPPGPYNYFAMVILFSLSIGTVFLATVWRWWNQAKRTRSRLS
ncbi:hypothetical protein C8R48DRAFT_587346 [Suillus tomentosus]|nr:hypothetical protein C8R48DRAFT_587346 [Suillus tomentosus]